VNVASAVERPAAPRIVVVGGGVIGVSTAYYLAKGGAQVTLLERGELAAGASYGNAGVIAPGHPPITKPGRVRQALRSLFRPLSPIYVAPRFDPALAAWLWTFARHSTERCVAAAMRTLAPMGQLSLRLFDELMAEERLDCHYRRGGYYEVCLTDAALRSAGKEAEFVRSYGFRAELVSGAELRRREPRLNEKVLGGVFYPEAATVHPHRFVLELAERARRLGVEFLTGADVAEVAVEGGQARGVRTSSGEVYAADAVVIATGAYTAPLTRRLGLRLPLQAAKGYHSDAVPRNGEGPLLREPCVLAETLVFCNPIGRVTRFAGTLELSGVNHEIRRPRLEQLTRAARRYFTGLDAIEIVSEWCGLRPCLPDGLPAVGPVGGLSGLYIATGHAMAGLTLGPATGKLLAESILGGAPSVDISALGPDRFA
jgi:D-amino-acid dehydrogenase